MIDFSDGVCDAIWRGLWASDKTREPMNALVIWTELGRGLCGNLDNKGADVGLIGRTIQRYCESQGAAPDVQLDKWAYRVEPPLRMDAAEVAEAMRAIESLIAEATAPLAKDAGDDGGKAVFTAVVKGWFQVGLWLLRALPAGRTASRAELLAALAKWCDRYLPHDPSGPADLGIRIVRR